MRCFVTVGTTKFDSLVKAVSTENFFHVLLAQGYDSLTIQVGSSVVDDTVLTFPGLSITWYHYKPSIEGDIAAADLVISHAGAGSCLEIMYANKPCIVVVNDTLMDNHQMELAEQLDKLQHVKYTNPGSLVDTLKIFNKNDLIPYERGRPERLAHFLSQIMQV